MTDPDQVTLVEGVVIENLPNTMFRVKVTEDQIVLGYLAGRMRRNYIRLLPGDRVRVEMTQYDTTRGRIVFKLK